MAKTWQSKKIVALVTALFLVPMLSGCMNIKVDLKIDQAARATGSYYVEFDKETAANFEISSKEEMFAFLTEKNSELKKGDVKLSESEKNYIANISVKGTPLDDKDMKAQVLSNGDIKFHYFAEPSNNSEDDKENFTPHIRRFYRPYLRNTRIYRDNFYNKMKEHFHRFLRKTGLIK
jgi:hypothetical protein